MVCGGVSMKIKSDDWNELVREAENVSCNFLTMENGFEVIGQTIAHEWIPTVFRFNPMFNYSVLVVINNSVYATSFEQYAKFKSAVPTENVSYTLKYETKSDYDEGKPFTTIKKIYFDKVPPHVCLHSDKIFSSQKKIMFSVSVIAPYPLGNLYPMFRFFILKR